MSSPSRLRIYLSCSRSDFERGNSLYELLTRGGFEPFWYYRNAPLGVDVDKAFREALDHAAVVLVCLSESSLNSQGIAREVVMARRDGKTVIPVYFDREVNRRPFPEELTFLRSLSGVSLDSAASEARLLAGLASIAEERGLGRRGAASASIARAPQIVRLRIENLRSYDRLELVVPPGTPLVLLAGDNASGKSTLFRAIALGLCRESESAALLKETHGRMIRRGSSKATIELELQQPDGDRLVLETRLLAGASGEEIVRKETVPDPFPWEDLFACAYGTGRGRPATSSHDRYALHPALRPLFSSEVSLQNPELVLLRQEPPLREELERRLLQVLMLDPEENQLSWNGGGPQIHGPWGDESLPALSDGYRSTTQWLLDFLSWAIQAGRFQDPRGIGGILLIDEIEQHLHPRWQRHILQRLCQQLPGTQIFASTHTPLVVSGTADIPGSKFCSLQLGGQGKTVVTEIDPETFNGQRADQILASEAFGMPTSRNVGAEEALAELARAPEERLPLSLGAETKAASHRGASFESNSAPRVRGSGATPKGGDAAGLALHVGTTPFEQKVESALARTLRDLALPGEEGALSEEGKRQLQELFGNRSGK
jgi:energy-coupling factor transporter ATP-binding protein EcfA2